MTREQLLHAVGDIRDTFIREAAPPPASYRKRREFPWAGAVAACLALVIVGSTFFLSQLGMGSGDTSANDAASAAENATAGESGGGASGPMTTTFLLPLSIGACVTLGGNVMTDAFGVVALVALTPLIAVQLMGVAYRIKMSRVEKRVVPAFDGRDEIVELEEEWA